MELSNAWKKYDEKKKKEIFQFTEGYRLFLSRCKTERECVRELKEKARAKGFVSLDEAIQRGSLKPGDKVYAENMGKVLVLFVIGEKGIEEGMKILGAHIDSPRLDIKPNPLYEADEFAYLDTHYYGGIKKYQWVTIPLSLHGVVIKKDGTKIELSIGEAEDDPVLGISDLLIHLAGKQMKKPASEVVEAEDLDILVGSMPITFDGTKEEEKKEKDLVKAYLLEILKEKYHFEEEDFLSAELEAVPAGKARDLGLDRSMILGYGQDDRVCAYTSFEALMDLEQVDRTCVCLLVDKEEIGSYGATGMHSHFFENVIAELLHLQGNDSIVALNRAFSHSQMLSSDVNAGYDPLYASVMDKRNASYLGKGMVFNKYTGAGGKSGASDANAEYIARLRKIMDEANVSYQVSELGKVGIGGGGTIAYILADRNVEVIDCGVSVLSMHAPFETTSKVDIYEAYRGYKTFLEKI